MSKQLIGWRICIGHKRNNGWIVRPIFQSALSDPCFIAPGLVLPKIKTYVGTTKEFCLDYYKGCCELRPGEEEVLLELDCTNSLQWPADAERWDWTCATEVMVDCPKVISITPTKELHDLAKSDSGL